MRCVCVVAAVTTVLTFSALAEGDPPSDPGAVQPPDWLQKIRFVAYSPSRLDPRPGHALPTDQEIQADLKTLRPYFDGLITYGAKPPVDRVLRMATALHFEGVVLGVWDPTDKSELALCVKLAREHAGLVKAICVGNEGLCFRRYNMTQLRQAMELLHAEVPAIPLATSEPISQYGDQVLQSLGDMHMPNIHPSFDLPPGTPPVQAVDWVLRRAKALADVSGKAVLCKESGYPSGGRAGFSQQVQQAFWQELAKRLAAAQPPSIAFAAFEAYDLPWKAQESMLPSEGFWGFWTSDRQPKSVVSTLAKLPTVPTVAAVEVPADTTQPATAH